MDLLIFPVRTGSGTGRARLIEPMTELASVIGIFVI
jgi:hypothetical protein